MVKRIIVFLIVGILVLGLYGYYTGTQVERCIYLMGDFIVCQEGWYMLGPVS